MIVRPATAPGILLCLIGFMTSAPAQASLHDRECLAFIGDTQTPIWIESLLLGGDRNEEATDSLFADILRVRPRALFMLGDLVSMGAYTAAWESIDRKITQVRAAQIAVHAILGNHELAVYSRTGEEYFSEGFPEHRRTGYCITVDSIAVVLLNSNFDKLEDAAQVEQHRWYLLLLDSLQADPGTACIVVCSHHPPFTNSTVVEPSDEVRRSFVPPFISTPKCLLYLSGHSHNLEHFKNGGKDLLVTGGGGGARHRLFSGADRNWADVSPERKPLFHYVIIERHGKSLHLSVRQLQEGFHGVEDGYSFTIGIE